MFGLYTKSGTIGVVPEEASEQELQSGRFGQLYCDASCGWGEGTSSLMRKLRCSDSSLWGRSGTMCFFSFLSQMMPFFLYLLRMLLAVQTLSSNFLEALTTDIFCSQTKSIRFSLLYDRLIRTFKEIFIFLFEDSVFLTICF